MIGKFETFITSGCHFFFKLWMPIAAIVPRTEAISEDRSAMSMVSVTACIKSSLRNSSPYFSSENPENSENERESLNEKKIIKRIGKYKKAKTSTI